MSGQVSRTYTVEEVIFEVRRCVGNVVFLLKRTKARLADWRQRCQETSRG